MVNSVRVLGVDASYRNIGLALVDVDLTTLALTPVEIALYQTEKSKNKQVRAASDHLHRSRQINAWLRDWEKRATIMAAEISSGAQSAAAAYGFGVATGALGGHTIELVEVSPTERIFAVVDDITGDGGRRVRSDRKASKKQIIDWAQERWPHLNWHKSKAAEGNPNEHMADAIAIVLAGTKTPNFRQIAAVMRAAA